VVDYASLDDVFRGRVSIACGFQEDHPLRNPGLLKELEVFCRLTELDRKEASPSEYEDVLNNGRAPLALLARLADYAVTHNTEDRTPEHISRMPSPLFRMYSSNEHASQCLEAEAKAGERLYAPIAELFGYPSLAGDILRHAYRINHEVIHGHVESMFEDGQMLEQLHTTQALARKLARRIRRTLAETGFKAEVVLRPEKHKGKVMRKFMLDLKEKFGKKGKGPDRFDDFIAAHIGEYDMGSLNDPVALKVILDSFLGKDINTMDGHEKRDTIRVALGVVRLNLRILKMVEGYTYKYDYKEKKNGYKAHHYDSHPSWENGKLPIEVQVKTREWDDLASHGKAAHYYYIGGDERFIDMVAGAYQDIIHRRYNGGNGPG
jgi:hypothetical protein